MFGTGQGWEGVGPPSTSVTPQWRTSVLFPHTMAVPAHQVPPHSLWYLTVCGTSKRLIPWKEKGEPKHISSDEWLRSEPLVPQTHTGWAGSSTEVLQHTFASQKSLNICHPDYFVAKGCSGVTRWFFYDRSVWVTLGSSQPMQWRLAGQAAAHLRAAESLNGTCWFAVVTRYDWLMDGFIWLHRHSDVRHVPPLGRSQDGSGLPDKHSLSITDAVWILFRRSYPLQAWLSFCCYGSSAHLFEVSLNLDKHSKAHMPYCPYPLIPLESLIL